MKPGARQQTNLIIGGTIKAATSSVFTYLSAHPGVCGSSVKETFFFTHKCTGAEEHDRALYRDFFDCSPGASVLLEASPNYLGYFENVAPYMRRVLPDAKLLFILRNPADRIHSHYHFAKAKLELPGDLVFEDYIDLCERYAARAIEPAAAGIPLQHLRGLEIGRYTDYLKNYYAAFDAGQILVTLYDDLRATPVRFMRTVCEFVELDGSFFESYRFHPVNVTFSGRRKRLHALAMSANRALERTLRRRPKLKRTLVRLYKTLNQDREGYGTMAAATRARIDAYYARSNAELRELLAGHAIPKWLE